MSNLKAGLIASIVITASVWMAGCNQIKNVIANADPVAGCVDSKLFADKKVCVQVHYEDKVKPSPEVAPEVK